ncbi:MAG: hypothetical protein JWL84_5604 [Rhodospirillales bacterium]|nr:hypothetical protein [Rhodospirillales bacterium]
MRILAVVFVFGLAGCAVAGDNRPSRPDTITYENLVQPFPRRDKLYCYAKGRKPFFVLSYGECVSRHGTLVSGAAEQWLEANWRWFQVAGWERLTRQTRRISEDLAARGYDPDSREYTEELTRRVAAYRKAHPEVVPKAKKAKKRIFASNSM